MDHVVVFETAHYIDGGIGLPNVRQKLVAQAFASAGPRHQAGNIDKLDNRRHHALGLDNRRQLGQARVRQLHHTHIGFDGAKRVVFGSDAGLGQGVEQRGLAHVRQTDDATLQTHASPLKNRVPSVSHGSCPTRAISRTGSRRPLPGPTAACNRHPRSRWRSCRR